MSSDSNGLGRAIAALREERGWKRKDLVAAAKISYPFLAEVENGNKRPSMAKLADIAQALDLTVGALMERAHQIDERFGGGPSVPQASASPTTRHAALDYSSPWGGAEELREPSEVDLITSSVMRSLEPRLRELVELEVRRQLDRQRGTSW